MLERWDADGVLYYVLPLLKRTHQHSAARWYTQRSSACGTRNTGARSIRSTAQHSRSILPGVSRFSSLWASAARLQSLWRPETATPNITVQRRRKREDEGGRERTRMRTYQRMMLTSAQQLYSTLLPHFSHFFYFFHLGRVQEIRGQCACVRACIRACLRACMC